MSDLPPGTVFAGHRIEAVVGRGGMGVVYRATQLDLDRTVALKLVAPELLEDETARRRFLQESRLAASIDHPHVIPIHYAGEEEGVPYLAMRYVAGDDARGLVRREGPLAAARSARIVAQVADALDAAHAAGLVHRDVKPANVLLASGDHAYLSDFGLTRHVRSISGATRSGQWVGTLDYVAPEQIRGGHVDARADVYALGCVLFFLLTGQVPFPREGDEARLWAHLTEPPPRVSEVAPDVPAAFDEVIRRALAKAPDERYPSTGDLGRAALAAAVGVPVAEPERLVASGDAAPVESATRTSERLREAVPARPPRRRLVALAALVGVTALAGTAVLLVPGGEDGEPNDGRGPDSTGTPAEPRVVARIRVGSRPNTLAQAGDRIWVGAFQSPNLQAIDRDTNRALPGLRPIVGEGTADLAVTRDTLWVAARRRRLVRLDLLRGRPLGPALELPGSPVALAADGDTVWAGLEQDEGDDIVTAQLVRIDAATGSIAATVPTTPGMAGIVFARGWLWTLHGNPSYIARRDPLTLEGRQRINLPGTSVGDLVYGERALWATIPDQDQLVRYQPASRRRATREVGSRPIGVAVRDGKVWVAASGSSTLDRIDAGTLKPAGEPIPVPLNPHAILVRGDEIWVTCVGVNAVVRLEAP